MGIRMFGVPSSGGPTIWEFRCWDLGFAMRNAHEIAVAAFFLSIMIFATACSKTAQPSSTPAPTATPVPEHKGARNPGLQSEVNKILPLFKTMTKVDAYVVDEPIEKTGSEVEKGVAYTTCSPSKIPVLYIKKSFYGRANQQQLTNILKHELTHAWFCTQGVQTGHDARFRAKFKEVGGFGN